MSVEGLKKSAVLILALGEEKAADVLKNLTSDELQRISRAISELKGVNDAYLRKVLRDFSVDVKSQSALGVNNDEFLKDILEKTLGEEDAGLVLGRILNKQDYSSGLDVLKNMPPKQAAQLIVNEHPQIISTILVFLTRQKAGEILTELPVEVRNEVISRIATLDGIPPEALTEVNISLSKLLLKDDSQRGLGGVRPAAEILNFLGTEVSDNVMQYVAGIDEELSQQIKDEMFIFDDIIKIRDRDMEIVLQQISSEGLVTALKGVSDALRDKFLNNMSRRAGDLLREDLEAKGPVKLSDVEKQQREILAVVTGLLGAGTISVMSEGDEEEFI